MNIIISVEEIYAYRELYYEHVKPLLKKGTLTQHIEECLKYFAPEYGITFQRYLELQTLDLLQRLGNLCDPKIEIEIGSLHLKSSELKCLSNLPELRCPKRSEQIKI